MREKGAAPINNLCGDMAALEVMNQSWVRNGWEGLGNVKEEYRGYFSLSPFVFDVLGEV